MDRNREPSSAVLVVEDEPFVRLMGVDLLEEAGFDVLQASNADEALRVLEAHPEVRVVLFPILKCRGARRIGPRAAYLRALAPNRDRSDLWSPLRAETVPREGRFLPKPYAGPSLVRQIKEVMR